MIWRAVGVIATQGKRVLLVYKVKASDFTSGAESIPGEWDFSKGGVKSSESDLEGAAQECFDRFNQRPETILSVISSNAKKVA